MNLDKNSELLTNSKLKVSFQPLTLHNRAILKLLVNKCFPINYTEEFYQRVAIEYKDLASYATLKDIIVGGIVCRIEIDCETNKPFVHLLIILVLEKYRGLGIAQQLMDFITNKIRETKESITHIQLHVQKANKKAVDFYKKQGFAIIEEIENYYDLEDSSAYKMKKDLI